MPSKTHMPKAMNTSQASTGQTGGQTLKPHEPKSLNVTKEHSVFLVELGWNVGRTASDSGTHYGHRMLSHVRKGVWTWTLLVFFSISGDAGWRPSSGTICRQRG